MAIEFEAGGKFNAGRPAALPLRMTDGEAVNVNSRSPDGVTSIGEIYDPAPWGQTGRRWEDLTDEEQQRHKPTIKLSDLSRLDVQPGDVLVYRIAGRMTAEYHDAVVAHVRRFLPAGVEVMVVEGAAEIAVIRPTP